MFLEFVNQYGFSLFYALITAIAGFIGLWFKKIYQEKCDDDTKRAVVKNCVLAVDQIYKNLHGSDKYNMCLQNAVEMLNTKGITVTELEARVLIEAAVREMNLDYMLGISEPVTDDEQLSLDMTEEEYMRK